MRSNILPECFQSPFQLIDYKDFRRFFPIPHKSYVLFNVGFPKSLKKFALPLFSRCLNITLNHGISG